MRAAPTLPRSLPTLLCDRESSLGRRFVLRTRCCHLPHNSPNPQFDTALNLTAQTDWPQNVPLLTLVGSRMLVPNLLHRRRCLLLLRWARAPFPCPGYISACSRLVAQSRGAPAIHQYCPQGYTPSLRVPRSDRSGCAIDSGGYDRTTCESPRLSV